MPSNIEIKARVRDMEALRRRVDSIADSESTTLEQEDVFYNVPSGRLKMRLLEGRGELIYYRRASEKGPKLSRYRIVSFENPTPIMALLEEAMGQRAVVKKKRILSFRGRTRIHLDAVEGLGDFMELEVVLDDGEEESTGRREARELMKLLGIDDSELITEAYVDLLEARGAVVSPGSDAKLP